MKGSIRFDALVLFLITVISAVAAATSDSQLDARTAVVSGTVQGH
jgi:hypothetical protein